MKRLAMLAVLGLVSVPAIANDLYVQGTFSHSNMYVGSSKGAIPVWRVAVGKDAGTMRYAADLTHYGDSEVQLGNTTHKTSLNSLGVSAVADLPIGNAPIVPYLGARVGVNHAAAKTSTTAADGTVTETKGDTTFLGAGLLAGVQYEVNSNLTLDAGLEYNRMALSDSDETFTSNIFEDYDSRKINQSAINLGVRYNF